MRCEWLVIAIAWLAVALKLSRDGAAVAPQLARDRGRCEPLHPKGMHRIAFAFGDRQYGFIGFLLLAEI